MSTKNGSKIIFLFYLFLQAECTHGVKWVPVTAVEEVETGFEYRVSECLL